MNEEMKRFSNLEGEQIELIKVNKQGLDDMHEYSKNPKFYKYMEYDVFKSRNETRKYLNRIIELTNSDSDYFWFIKLRSSKNKRVNEVIFGMLKKEFLKKYGN